MKKSHPIIKNEVLENILRPKRIAFIVNPKAGTRMKKDIRKSVERNLDLSKFEYGIWTTEGPGHARELAKKAVEDGYEFVVAVGGDGSINEVASQLYGTAVVLGIVPAGSGNGLAMHLGYGREMDRAIVKLNSASVQEIDVALFNGKPYFNLAGIGFDGMVSNRMAALKDRSLIRYFYEAVKIGLAYRSKDFKFEVDGKVLNYFSFAISIANGPMYGYNVEIAPGAKLDDGLLSVVVLKDAPKRQYFAAVPGMFRGRILDAPFVEHFSARSLKIRSEGVNFVHLDGEALKVEGEIKIDISPDKLKVLVPDNKE